MWFALFITAVTAAIGLRGGDGVAAAAGKSWPEPLRVHVWRIRRRLSRLKHHGLRALRAGSARRPRPRMTVSPA
jgi:hypothetical protein